MVKYDDNLLEVANSGDDQLLWNTFKGLVDEIISEEPEDNEHREYIKEIKKLYNEVLYGVKLMFLFTLHLEELVIQSEDLLFVYFACDTKRGVKRVKKPITDYSIEIMERKYRMVSFIKENAIKESRYMNHREAKNNKNKGVII